MTIHLKVVQAPAVALYTGLSSTGNSMRITPYPVDLDGNKLAITDFGDVGYATVDPKQTGFEEIVSFSGMTDNGDNTCTLTGLSRNLTSRYPYTTTGTGKIHGSSAVVVFSDNPQIFGRLAGKDNDETISGVYSFTAVPNASADPVSPNDLVRYSFLLNNLPGGVVSVNAVKVAGTAGATVAAGNMVYLDTATGRWKLASSAATATLENVLLGIAQGAGTNGFAIAGGVLLSGIDANQTGLVAGSKYYIQDVAGTIGTSAGTLARVIGIANSATTLYFNPDFFYIPKAGSLDGLSGTAPSATNKFIDSQLLVGIPLPWPGKVTPTGTVALDGSAVARTGTYSRLFAIYCPSFVVTMTIASPCVITKTAHGLVAGDQVHFTTTGALPTGLALNTTYYVLSTGLTANAFEVALSPEGTAVNTSGTQSGVHTCYNSNYGKGDGATTFALPDLRGRGILGLGAPSTSLAFEPGAVSTGADTIAVPSFITFPYQGQKVQLTSTGTLPAGLSLATDYYVIRISSTSIKLATTQALADAGTGVDITGTGTGVHTMTHAHATSTVLGEVGGEGTHGLSVTELASHTHTDLQLLSSATGTSGVASVFAQSGGTTGSTGGDTPHNNLSPHIRMNWITIY